MNELHASIVDIAQAMKNNQEENIILCTRVILDEIAKCVTLFGSSIGVGESGHEDALRLVNNLVSTLRQDLVPRQTELKTIGWDILHSLFSLLRVLCAKMRTNDMRFSIQPGMRFNMTEYGNILACNSVEAADQRRIFISATGSRTSDKIEEVHFALMTLLLELCRSCDTRDLMLTVAAELSVGPPTSARFFVDLVILARAVLLRLTPKQWCIQFRSTTPLLFKYLHEEYSFVSSWSRSQRLQIQANLQHIPLANPGHGDQFHSIQQNEFKGNESEFGKVANSDSATLYDQAERGDAATDVDMLGNQNQLKAMQYTVLQVLLTLLHLVEPFVTAAIQKNQLRTTARVSDCSNVNGVPATGAELADSISPSADASRLPVSMLDWRQLLEYLFSVLRYAEAFIPTWTDSGYGHITQFTLHAIYYLLHKHDISIPDLLIASQDELPPDGSKSAAAGLRLNAAGLGIYAVYTLARNWRPTLDQDKLCAIAVAASPFRDLTTLPKTRTDDCLQGSLSSSFSVFLVCLAPISSLLSRHDEDHLVSCGAELLENVLLSLPAHTLTEKKLVALSNHQKDKLSLLIMNLLLLRREHHQLSDLVRTQLSGVWSKLMMVIEPTAQVLLFLRCVTTVELLFNSRSVQRDAYESAFNAIRYVLNDPVDVDLTRIADPIASSITRLLSDFLGGKFGNLHEHAHEDDNQDNSDTKHCCEVDDRENEVGQSESSEENEDEWATGSQHDTNETWAKPDAGQDQIEVGQNVSRSQQRNETGETAQRDAEMAGVIQAAVNAYSVLYLREKERIQRLTKQTPNGEENKGESSSLLQRHTQVLQIFFAPVQEKVRSLKTRINLLNQERLVKIQKQHHPVGIGVHIKPVAGLQQLQLQHNNPHSQLSSLLNACQYALNIHEMATRIDTKENNLPRS